MELSCSMCYDGKRCLNGNYLSFGWCHSIQRPPINSSWEASRVLTAVKHLHTVGVVDIVVGE